VLATLSFIVLIVPLVFSVFTDESFETIKLVVWLVFFGTALLMWVRRKLSVSNADSGNTKAKVRMPRVLGYLFGFLVLFAFFSALLAPDKWYSFFGFYYRFTNSFIFLLLWALSFVLFCDVLDQSKLNFLLKIFVIDALIVAIKAILESQGLTLYQGVTFTPILRNSPSLLGNSNFSSMFMASLIPFVVLFWSETKSFWFKIFYALVLFVVLSALAILTSRGALLALACGIIAAVVLLFFSWRKFKQSLIKILAATTVATVFILTSIGLSRPDFFVPLMPNNIAFRLQVWQQSLVGVGQHPLFGVGLGNFAIFHERLPRPADMGVFDDSHNLWIFLAVSGGLPLALLFMGLIVWAFKRGFDYWRRSGSFQVLAILCSLTIFIVAAGFNPIPIPCFLFLAVLLGGTFAITSNPSDRIKLGSLVGSLAGICAIIFIIWGAILLLGETTLHLGKEDYLSGDFTSAQRLLSFSSKINPSDQLSLVYLIYSQEKNGAGLPKILPEIQRLKSLHPQISTTYIMAADEYFQLFNRSKDPIYLQQSIAEMSQALIIDPTYAERYGQRGLYYFFKQDYDSAMADFEKSLSLKPTLLPSLILEARIFQLRQDRPHLLDVLERAYVAYPDDPRVRIFRYVAKHSPNVRDVPLNLYSQVQ